MTICRALRSIVLATLLIAPVLATPARALTPDAVTAVAVRLGRSLPVGWGAAQDAAVAAAIAANAAAAAADPELTAAAHRFDAGAATGAGAGDARDAFVAAVAGLRAARLAPDADGCVAPVAALALAACDLADPFLVTAPDADEVAGARAAFEDTWDGAALAAAPTAAAAAGDAAVALATASAAVRADIEAAAAAGDDAAIARLRAGRLGDALGTAQAAADAAWSTLAVPAPELLAPRGMSLWPNPAAGAVRVGFALPAAGAARLTVVDAAGRRVLDRALGARAAGAQSVVLEAAAVRSLAVGAYFVRITTPATTLQGRLVRVQRD